MRTLDVSCSWHFIIKIHLVTEHK